jgi:CheY-like chemotaxis protein
MVVEDHEDTREMLCLLGEAWGLRVVEAWNGLEAVEAALLEKPQLILGDSQLPFIGGLEATSRIRENRAPESSQDSALNGSGSPRYLAPLCRISVLSQEVKCQNHDRCYQQ